jgi:hypothetical protein
MSKRIALVLSLTVALALTAQVALADTMKPQLVRTIVDPKLGKVLTTGGRQAIYVWNKEPKGTIKCTGACAKAWPPVIVKTGVVVPMHVKGIKRTGRGRRVKRTRQRLPPDMAPTVIGRSVKRTRQRLPPDMAPTVMADYCPLARALAELDGVRDVLGLHQRFVPTIRNPARGVQRLTGRTSDLWVMGLVRDRSRSGRPPSSAAS